MYICFFCHKKCTVEGKLEAIETARELQSFKFEMHMRRVPLKIKRFNF